MGEGDRGTLFAAVGMEFEAVADTPLLYDDWKSYVEEAAGSLKEMGPSFARTPLFTSLSRNPSKSFCSQDTTYPDIQNPSGVCFRQENIEIRAKIRPRVPALSRRKGPRVRAGYECSSLPSAVLEILAISLPLSWFRMR